MEYIQGNKLKKLQNLFSWSQFYSNSSLSVNRWTNELLMVSYNTIPSQQYKDSWKLERYYSFNKTINDNRKKADLIQEEIIKISNPNQIKNNNSSDLNDRYRN